MLMCGRYGFFFQAEDGIRDLVRSRGLGDVYKRQPRTLPDTRDNLSKYAPRLRVLQIRPDKIGDLIGPQGKNIKKIIEETGVKIDIEPDGKVYITSPDEEHMEQAVYRVGELTDDIELGKIYKGKVVSIREFGAFVEIQKGKDGLLHISEISNSKQRINKVEDYLKEKFGIKVEIVTRPALKDRIKNRILKEVSYVS